MNASWRGSGRTVRYRYRLLIGMMVILVPMMIGLTSLLISASSVSLTRAAQNKGEGVAKAVTLRLEDWMSERREDLVVLAADLTNTSSDAASGASLTRLATVGSDYDMLEVVDLNGKVLATSGSDKPIDVTGRPWFATATSGQPAGASPIARAGGVDWILAHPIMSVDGHVAAVLVANLSISSLATLLNPELDETSQVVAVDSNGLLVYSTSMGKIEDGAALLAAGGLKTKVQNVALDRASATNKTGSANYRDLTGAKVIGGFDRVEALDWTLLEQVPERVVLAPQTSQRRRATELVGIGVLVAAVAALIFARMEARKLRSFAEGTRLSGVEVNSAAAELSASSEELAATTTQQSAAVTQASATTEELARASAAIADTVDDVAAQTAATRDNLERAEADIQVSSERTLALAGRVHEIGGLLTLINEIADQTNLLALNAAIEAARAGEEGRGFAVVADEVRRLAERSKSSAGDISLIVDAVREETNATVMAMEKGAKQMQAGLLLLERVTDAAGQVRLTTQQQRSATSQVVDTMEQLTDASRQVSATAQQIAAAAGSLANLAGNLETTATSARDRY